MTNPTGQITPYFWWHEFTCNGCLPGGVHEGVECEMPISVIRNLGNVVRLVLYPARFWLGVPIIIVSGYRCPLHNRAVGGAKTSQHVLGTAVDFRIPGFEAEEVYRWFDAHMKNVSQVGPGGMGKYGVFTHLDIRPTSRAVRWNG